MTLIDSDCVHSMYQLGSSKDLLCCEHRKLDYSYKMALLAKVQAIFIEIHIMILRCVFCFCFLLGWSNRFLSHIYIYSKFGNNNRDI